MSFSPRSFPINFSEFRLINGRNYQDKLTKSPLLGLLGSDRERRDQFYNYLHQDVCQGWRGRNSGINTESAEEVLEGREKVDQGFVASTQFVDRLGKSGVKEIDWRRGDIRQVRCRNQRILLLRAGMAVEAIRKVHR
jgi:hypothetical protein